MLKIGISQSEKPGNTTARIYAQGVSDAGAECCLAVWKAHEYRL